MRTTVLYCTYFAHGHSLTASTRHHHCDHPSGPVTIDAINRTITFEKGSQNGFSAEVAMSEWDYDWTYQGALFVSICFSMVCLEASVIALFGSRVWAGVTQEEEKAVAT